MRGGYLWRLLELAVHPAVILTITAPVVAYQVLAGRGVSPVDALAVSAIFPAAGGVFVMLRSRRIDPLALLSLTAIGIGLIAGLVFHNGRILLVKDSLTTGTLGVVFLCSLLTRRPMSFTLRRRLFVRDQPDALAAYDRTWWSRAVRAEARRSTALWGAALFGEAALRVGLSYLVPTGTLVIISPLLALLVFGPLAVRTLRLRGARHTTPDSPSLV